MARAFLVVAALSLMMAGLAILLWQWAAHQQKRRIAARHLAHQLAVAGAETPPPFDPRRPVPAPGVSVDPWAMAPADGSLPVLNSARLRLPGWLEGVVTLKQLGRGLAGALVLVLGLALFAGPIAAGSLAMLLLLGAAFAIWLRLQKIRRKLVSQLPGFIDALVRLITIGNSTHAAFQLSIVQLKSPLREHMEGAAALVRAGVELDQAIDQTARKARIEEMHLLASILGLGVRYGGRADTLLERVAAFMRDREQAQHELVAMSSETRLSAWILGLLPIGVGSAIVLVNPGYFARMWQDSAGQMMIFGAFGLQLLGVFMLYRLARLG